MAPRGVENGQTVLSHSFALDRSGPQPAVPGVLADVNESASAGQPRPKLAHVQVALPVSLGQSILRAVTAPVALLGAGWARGETAQELNNLGAHYYELGRYAEAEPLYIRSLAIREKAASPAGSASV